MFILNLNSAGLNGRKALEGYNVESVVVYEGK